MSGGCERYQDQDHQHELRALRHEVGNALFAIELTAEAMAGTDDPRQRERLQGVLTGEVDGIRSLMRQLTGASLSESATAVPHQHTGRDS